MQALTLSHVFKRTISFGRPHTYPLKEFKFHKIKSDALPKTAELTKSDALKYFEQMTTIRLMENEAGRLYMQKSIKGFCHLYSGQEACAVGTEAAVKKDDSLITAYRCHGFSYTRGLSVAEILCELTGRVSGASKGRGGSMHIYAHEFYGGNGIVGAHVPLGAGIALAHKLRNNGKISIALYGDGLQYGCFKLPIIFVCENNKFGMGTSCERASASLDYYSRGDFIPGIKVDGSCVLSVREVMKYCRNWCLEGKGPIVVEFDTYRYSGHSMSDPGTSYRKVEDVQKVRKSRDPIVTFTELIASDNLVSQKELDEIKERQEEIVEKAKEKALSDPFPEVKDIGLHVYHGGTVNGFVRGCSPYVQYESNK
ncbi:Pyruvate dehydrogenase E1 component subunit alpha, somatic form, mitochondrial [Thelohanellus kitauei]|uniref:pyruvate dehydrogenase (acetyl-transferring) n=1 Tax=Thelohanellus kitauei TaxID=669202 RepID=A0A0C2MWB8_THEKT|nr:Pyruvate dehydrogenase E1 component subunit alpha, somatic form, mitochondrial [Thelohanellus kitauei]